MSSVPEWMVELRPHKGRCQGSRYPGLLGWMLTTGRGWEVAGGGGGWGAEEEVHPARIVLVISIGNVSCII